MEQSKKQISLAAKIAIIIVGVVISAVLVTFIQQLLFGKKIVAVTSAVISVSTITIWWLLRRSAK